MLSFLFPNKICNKPRELISYLRSAKIVTRPGWERNNLKFETFLPRTGLFKPDVALRSSAKVSFCFQMSALTQNLLRMKVFSVYHLIPKER